MTLPNVSNPLSVALPGAPPATGNGLSATAEVHSWTADIPQIVERVMPVITAVLAFFHWWSTRNKVNP